MARRADPGPTRRSLIRLMGGVAGVGLMPLNFGCREYNGYSRGSLFLPTPDRPLTPVHDFYVNTNFGRPEVPQGWRLYVDGLVDEPLTLTLDDLQAMPQISRDLTLECIGNSPGGTLISSGRFTGVPLGHVLDLAGRSDRARGLRFLGLDGYPAYLPVDVVDEGALLVHRLGGEPIDAEHGAPLRCLVPGRYGMFNIKWLDSITATREYATYGSLGQLASFVETHTHIRSRIDSLYDGATIDVGVPVTLTGLAVTPGDGVARVQVDTGDGWRDAELTFNDLDDGQSGFLWSLWSSTFTPARAGMHTLRVRAFDPLGGTQDPISDFPYDAGALHRVVVHAV